MDEQVSAHHVTNTAPPPDVAEKKYNFPILIFFRDARLVFEMDSLGREILRIAVPAAMALAADPLASLIDTAFIGHLGPVEIAAVGVSIAIFNQASKVTIFPLVSITTSFVAEEETVQRINNETVKGEALDDKCGEEDVVPPDLEGGSRPTNGNVVSNKEKRHIPSASTALVVGGILGIIQAVVLLFAANTLLHVMGVKAGSAMLIPAHKYLTLRSLGSPAVLLSLAMQGVFRGLKDTKTPLYATGEYIKLSGTPFLSFDSHFGIFFFFFFSLLLVAGDVTNIILDPIFIFVCKLGVSGAAIAHVISQQNKSFFSRYLITVILLVKLMKMIHLLPPSMKDLQFSRFLKNGFLLLAKVIAATICVTFAASRAARLGSTPMAAFQICLQVWLTSSLLADGLAVAGQAIIATAFAEKDYHKATSAATRVLQMSFLLGLGLAGVVGAGLYFGDTIFSKDPIVLHIISIGIPFVAATQPLNSIAFVFDGVNFGASDFRFSSYSMVLVAMATLPAVYLLSNSGGFIGIWVALTIFMGLRTFVGIWRMGTATGPWQFLKGPTSS
ncbi:Protein DETOXIFICATION 43 [Linum perenne]